MSYQVVNLRALRAGGNGNLFIGQRNDTGEHVVVKFLREHRLPEARRNFAREVRILQQRFRHTLQILYANTDADRPYYVIPYLPGGSLTRHAGLLTDAQLQTAAWEVALALADLHAAWIAHGDIKPDNVLLAHDGHIHVADPLGNGFGCTVLFANNCGGTPGYWAPEVRIGGPISQAGDVYSYGAMLYHVLTRQRPRDDQRLDLEAVRIPGSSKIREIITACCQPNPSARPKMTEVLRLLRGETWMNVQVERTQRREALKAVCIVGGIFIGAKLLT